MELPTLDNSLCTPERGENAYRVEQLIRDLKTQIGRNFLAMGKLLKEVRDNRYYLELGHSSMSAWLSEISISASWAWNFIDIYEVFIVQYQLDENRVLEIDYTKLSSIIPIIREHPEEMETWMTAAESLRRIDLQKEIKQYHISEKQKFVEKTRGTIDGFENQVANSNPSEGLLKLEPKSVDVIMTSIPDETSDLEWLGEIDRCLTDAGVVVCVLGLKNLFRVGTKLESLGYTIIRDIVIKKSTVTKPITLNSLLAVHDTVIWARRGPQAVCNLTEVADDVWEIPNRTNYDCPGEKPEFLWERLIELTTDPGQLIVDPIAGSGQVLTVARRLQRRVMGFIADDYWYQTCLTRLADMV